MPKAFWYFELCVRRHLNEASGKGARTTSLLGTFQVQKKVCCCRWEACNAFFWVDLWQMAKKKEDTFRWWELSKFFVRFILLLLLGWRKSVHSYPLINLQQQQKKEDRLLSFCWKGKKGISVLVCFVSWSKSKCVHRKSVRKREK